MFNKILIANRGVLAKGQAKQNRCAAAVSSHGLARIACAGDFVAEVAHV